MTKSKKIIASITNRKKLFCENKNVQFISWRDFLNYGENVQYEKNTDEHIGQNVVAVVHTGGTTGTPKGVMLTNSNLIAEYYNYNALDFDFCDGDVYLNILVPWVAYGLVFCYFVVFCLGFESVLVPLFSPEMITKLVLKYKPAQILGIPAYYEQMLHDKRLEGKDLSFLKCLGSGGDSISVQKEKEFNEFLSKHHSPSRFVKGYGMTELSSSACTCIKSVNKIGSVGIPLINNTIAIFGTESGEEKCYGEIGEVCILSPTMMKGYDCEANNGTVMKRHSDGKVWIHSGDIGYMDHDGCVFIVDRIKRMIIRRGFKVYPSEIEKVVMRNSEVEACVVVGKKHELDVQTPHIFIKAKTKNDDLIKFIYESLRKELPEYEIPYENDYQFISEMPLTAIGKVDFKLLEKMAEK